MWLETHRCWVRIKTDKAKLRADMPSCSKHRSWSRLCLVHYSTAILLTHCEENILAWHLDHYDSRPNIVSTLLSSTTKNSSLFLHEGCQKKEATMGFFHMRRSFYSMQTRFPWTWSRKSKYQLVLWAHPILFTQGLWRLCFWCYLVCLIFPGPIWSGPDTTRKNKEGSPDRGQVEPSALRMLSYQSTIMFVCSSVSALGWCRCLCEKKINRLSTQGLSPLLLHMGWLN